MNLLRPEYFEKLLPDTSKRFTMEGIWGGEYIVGNDMAVGTFRQRTLHDLLEEIRSITELLRRNPEEK